MPFVKDAIFSKSGKHLKNSITLFNNNKRNLTNKSVMNRSLMQNRKDHSSSISETISSEEEIMSKNTNNNDFENTNHNDFGNTNHNDNDYENHNTNFLDTKQSSNFLDTLKSNNFEQNIKDKSLTPTNIENRPPSIKINQLFLNTSSGNMQNFIPIKSTKNNNQGFSFDQNLSYINSMVTNSQMNKTAFEETHKDFATKNNNNSPNVLNKTMQKFKSFLNKDNNNKRKVYEKFQNNNESCLPAAKNKERKNLSALFTINKEDNELEETNYKLTSEALIKKNHQLQIENYNLRRSIVSDKNLLSFKIKRIYDLIKMHFEKTAGSKTKFDLCDLDFLIDILEKNMNQGFRFEIKEKVLHQFDNLRDYYRVIFLK